MTNLELALELARAVSEARFGERALMATLFGIKHHRQLDERIVAEILSMNNPPSGPIHYDVAINRGRALAKYVDLESGQYRAQAELAKSLDAHEASCVLKEDEC